MPIRLPSPSQRPQSGGLGGLAGSALAGPSGEEFLEPFLGPNLFSIILYKLFKDIQGCNSIDILNFGRKTRLHSGPNSVLGHYKFRHVSKLLT